MTTPLPENSTIKERYQLLRCLYQRDQTQTWLAQDQVSQTEVILKVLDLAHLPDWQQYELFEREARILGLLEHPRIPALRDHFHLPEQQKAVLVLACLPGETVRERIQRGWKVTEDKARDLATQALEILSYLHNQQPAVIHRDLKPENILLDAEDQLYLIDFGAVREQSQTRHTVAGSFAYMAPEQFHGRVVPASDLYGLGMTLLELLSGCAPQDLPRQGLYLDLEHLHLSAGFKRWFAHLVAPFLPQRFTSAAIAQAALKAPEHLPAVKMQASLKPRHQDEELTPQLWLKRQPAALIIEIRGRQHSLSLVFNALTQVLGLLVLSALAGWVAYHLIHGWLSTQASDSAHMDLFIIPGLLFILPQLFVFMLLRLQGVQAENQELEITDQAITHRYLKARGLRKPTLITRVYTRKQIKTFKIKATQLQICLRWPQRLAFKQRIALPFPFPKAARERLKLTLQAEHIPVE